MIPDRFRRPLLAAAGLALVAIGGGTIFAAAGGPAQDRVVTFFFINLTAVVGLQIFMGSAHVTNFGHISFMGIAAFTSAIVTLPVATKQVALPQVPFGLGNVELGMLSGAAVALALTVVVAAATGLVVARINGIAASIATLALLFIVHSVLLNWEDLTRGSRVLFGVPLHTTLPWAMGAAGVTIVSARLFRDSRAGVQLRAGGEDALAAAAMGADLRRLRFLAWIVSSLFVGLAGVLYVHFLGSVSPDAFWLHLTFLTVAMLLLGGLGSVSGAVVGTIFVTAGFELMRWLEQGPTVAGANLPDLIGLSEVFLGLVIVVTMARRPTGLVGDDEIDERFGRWQLERRARRNAASRAAEVRSPGTVLAERSGVR